MEQNKKCGSLYRNKPKKSYIKNASNFSCNTPRWWRRRRVVAKRIYPLRMLSGYCWNYFPFDGFLFCNFFPAQLWANDPDKFFRGGGWARVDGTQSYFHLPVTPLKSLVHVHWITDPLNVIRLTGFFPLTFHYANRTPHFLCVSAVWSGRLKYFSMLYFFGPPTWSFFLMIRAAAGVPRPSRLMKWTNFIRPSATSRTITITITIAIAQSFWSWFLIRLSFPFFFPARIDVRKRGTKPAFIFTLPDAIFQIHIQFVHNPCWKLTCN